MTVARKERPKEVTLDQIYREANKYDSIRLFLYVKGPATVAQAQKEFEEYYSKKVVSKALLSLERGFEIEYDASNLLRITDSFNCNMAELLKRNSKIVREREARNANLKRVYPLVSQDMAVMLFVGANEPVSIKQIIGEFKERMPEKTVWKRIDSCLDSGTLIEDWKKVGSRNPRRVLRLSKEYAEDVAAVEKEALKRIHRVSELREAAVA